MLRAIIVSMLVHVLFSRMEADTAETRRHVFEAQARMEEEGVVFSGGTVLNFNRK